MTENDLIITGWQAGVAESAELGFADMRNVVIDEVPGAVTCANLPTKESGTTITGLPTWVVRNPVNGDLWCLDDDGKTYTSTDGGDTWSLVSGNTLPSAGNGGHGLAIWKGYLFVTRANKIDVYGPLASSPSWTNGWQTLTNTFGNDDAGPIVLTPDDKLTGANVNLVWTVVETAATTFEPGTGGTYTFTAAALTLPNPHKIKAMVMHGLDLRIGTFVGADAVSYPYQKKADVFAWDRTSTSFTGAKTISLQEFGVHALAVKDGLLYIVAGTKGNVYVSNGAETQLFKRLKSIALSAGAWTCVRPGAIAVFDNRLWIGIGGGAGVTKCGVYAITNEGGVTLENVISTGDLSSVVIGALYAVNDFTALIGWQTGSAQGVDLVGKSNARVTSYGSYVDSPLFRVGSPARKRTFTEAEFQLEKPLSTGEGVKLQYRTNTGASWTDIATVDNATYGSMTSYAVPASIADVERLQIRVLLTTYSAGTTSPILTEVRLR